MKLIRDLKKAMSAEYNDVKIDPVFKHIMTIADNKLGFSWKLVDSFLCKQLITSKMHEKCSDIVTWKNDGGFWSNLLRTCDKITLKSIRKVHLKEVHKWTRIDRMRLIYLCVIMGVVMGREEKVNILDMYIKLVMDLDKLRKFHWGLHSYDFLMSSIEKARKKLDMELELPKRLYAEGLEPQVKKINKCCRMELIRDLKKAMSAEYNDVTIDPVFKHIMAIAENKLNFSEKLVDSFLCKQLITSKMHDKWFVFARTPLRFSLQEYHAVTSSDVVTWKNDRGFWSNLLRTGDKITLKSIRKVHLKEVHKLTRIDRMRLIYLCVIMGVVMGRDEKVNIPDMYIKLVMDLDKLRKFHWGLHSYDFLLSSIEKARKKLGKKASYIFEGFPYALQIWIVEAILDFGEICGSQVSSSFIGPRCGNWKGVAKVSYEDIIELEDSLTKKEYHAVTGLKVSRESSSDVVTWKNDGGFWSNLLRTGDKITLKSIRKVHLKEVHKWTRIDRMRLIYLCVIMGVVMGRDEKVNIPDMYIKLVMDLDNLRKFHWGLHSYDFLLSSIEKARKKLGKKASYIFEGFSNALQIWIMEATPDFGEICGSQVSSSFVGPRCGNWKGVAKVSYEDIIELEDSLTKKGVLFSVISVSGNGDMFLYVDYTRKGEMEDERLDLLLDRIKEKFDWSNTERPVLEPEETEMEEADSQDRGLEADKAVDDTDVLADEETSSVTVARKGKRKILDEGAETRKKKLLCKRSAEKKLTFGPETKSFIEGLIQTSVTSLGDMLSSKMANMERMFTERMGKMEIEVSHKKASEEAPHYCCRCCMMVTLLELSLLHDGNIIGARHRVLWDLLEAANDPELIERIEID
ncbi:hypothetical protein F2Q69_00053620 [Brassica cretica]|uniref:DUF1985 domain-containing protein n=1 Tax=Brassica cretica TaxID=69181 RepID=A0A8S9MW21_BRACR|nr:hypothetical protein F2Q69_00053620 [Brassica cretica]